MSVNRRCAASCLIAVIVVALLLLQSGVNAFTTTSSSRRSWLGQSSLSYYDPLLYSSSSSSLGEPEPAHEEEEEEAGGEQEQVLLSAVLQGLIDEDDDGEEVDHDMEDYNEDEVETKNVVFKSRKAQWKSKRYVMLQDVSRLIADRSPKSMEQAEHVVNKLEQVYNEKDFYKDKAKPHLIQAYNLWLQAISKTGDKKSKGPQAEAVLRSMPQRGIAPTVISYTICIMAYRNSAKDAERLLFELLELQSQDPALRITSSITTDAVLQAWAQEGTLEAAERAHQILERLQQFSADSAIIEANSHTYSIVMNAYSKLGRVEEVEAMLLKRKQADARLGGESLVIVDTVLYNVAIKAWAQSKDARAGSRATALLEEMQGGGGHTAPDVITYNSVLSAWSKCGHVNAAKEAERILQQMIVASKQKKSKRKKKQNMIPHPNVVSYNTVLHAWANQQPPQANAVTRASTILEYMIKSPDSPSPDIYSFTSVLNVLAKSKTQTDKAAQARKLLDTLLQLSDQGLVDVTTNICYNIVINTCAFSASFDSDTRMQALQIAITTFAELRASSKVKPDDVTYGMLVKAIANLTKRGAKRQQLALTVLRQCMEDGLVGSMVWQQLPRVISQAQMSQILPNALQDKPNVELIDLPRSWRRNVKIKAQRRQRRRNKPKAQPKPRKARPPIRKPHGLTEQSWQSGKDL